MESAPTVLLAALIASRSEMSPSAPGLAISCSTDATLPSITSAVVDTVSGPPTSVTVTAMAWVSDSAPALARTVTWYTLLVPASVGSSKSGGVTKRSAPVALSMLKRAASLPPMML